MDKMKKILLGIIGVLAALLYFFFKKNQSAEGLLQNQKTKEELTKIDEKINEVKGLEAAEEEKRKNITENMKKEENKDVSKEDMLDFFNRKPKP